MALTKAAAARKDANTGLCDMQHRHFAAIACIISDLSHEMGRGDAYDVAEFFARKLASTNPKFDSKRFMDACQS